MHILLAGGRGLLGTALAQHLRAAGHVVAVLTRTPRAPHERSWSDVQRAVSEADAVVNLAGESIAAARWTSARKAAILESRVSATRTLVEAMRTAGRTPAVFASSSAIGIYGARDDAAVTEETPPGHDFLARVCVAWEAEAAAAAALTRVVLLRTGVVFAREGGALPQMALPFRLFAGGPVGSGRQYVSWVHIDDWTAMTAWAIRHGAVAGPLNITAPEPVRNADLAGALGRALHRPSFIPAPAFALRLALGEMATIVLDGQRVLPAKAQALGFTFRYPALEPALATLLP